MYQIYAYCFILHRIKTMFPKKLEPLDICPKCKDIVIYCYKNNQNEKIYHCFNKNCNYQLIKKN